MANRRRKAILGLAKKEYMDNIRNKWVIILGIVFVGLILLISAYGGIQGGRDAGFKGFEFTIGIGSSVVVLLTSIVAVVMGYKTISQEVESKSIALLLTSELSRNDIVLGKFMGLSSVLATSIFGGLGIGGIVIGITSGFEDANLYLGFILFSIIFGTAYISLSILMSSVLNKRSSALAGGIFLWIFFNIIWDLVLLGLLVATGWELPTTAGDISYPTWYYSAGLFNPNSTFSIGLSKMLGGASSIPDILTPYTTGIALLIWIFVPLVVAMLIFNIKDL